MNPDNLAVAFSVWAAIVGLVGAALVWELSRLRSEIKAIADRLNNSVVEFEHRLTAVESDIRRCPSFSRDN